MATPLPASWVGYGGETQRQGTHLVSAQQEFRDSRELKVIAVRMQYCSVSRSG